jgi:hypothetical protein
MRTLLRASFLQYACVHGWIRILSFWCARASVEACVRVSSFFCLCIPTGVLCICICSIQGARASVEACVRVSSFYGLCVPHDRTASVLAGAGQSTRDTGGETRVNSQLRDTHAHQGRGYRGDNTHTGRRHGAKGAMKSQGMSPARMTRNATRWGARNSEDLLR